MYVDMYVKKLRLFNTQNKKKTLILPLKNHSVQVNIKCTLEQHLNNMFNSQMFRKWKIFKIRIFDY